MKYRAQMYSRPTPAKLTGPAFMLVGATIVTLGFIATAFASTGAL